MKNSIICKKCHSEADYISDFGAPLCFDHYHADLSERMDRLRYNQFQETLIFPFMFQKEATA